MRSHHSGCPALAKNVQGKSHEESAEKGRAGIAMISKGYSSITLGACRRLPLRETVVAQ